MRSDEEVPEGLRRSVVPGAGGALAYVERQEPAADGDRGDREDRRGCVGGGAEERAESDDDQCQSHDQPFCAELGGGGNPAAGGPKYEVSVNNWGDSCSLTSPL